MKLGLVAVLVLVAAGCASSHPVSSSPKAPQMPHLRTKPYPGSPVCPRHPRTQIDLDACAGRRWLAADARFNRMVTAMWPGLDAISRRSFARGQQAWVRYRDDECDVWRRVFLGGSIAPLVKTECEVALTRARVKDLDGLRELVPG